jgi:2'-5' RNA ligase
VRRDIGVAIAVPEPWATQLRELRESFGDSSAEGIPPHVTLLPPTRLPPARVERVEDHLVEVARNAEPFDIELAGSGTFRPVSPVVFVPLVAGIAPCELLESRVRSGPLARDVLFPYHPHVTVAHGVDDPALDAAYLAMQDFRASFRVSGFTCFERNGSGSWRPVRTFPLGAG